MRGPAAVGPRNPGRRDDVAGLEGFPTWFAVAQHDQVIPPDAERLFAQRMGATTVEVDSSHVVMISHPEEMAALIQSAVDAVKRR